MYYMLNSKGVLLSSLGYNLSDAFSDLGLRIRMGAVINMTWRLSGNTVTTISESGQRTQWEFNSRNRTLSNENGGILKFFRELD